MKWQVKYALENTNKRLGSVGSAEHVNGDAIKISIRNRPEIFAVISESAEITIDEVVQYHEQYPAMDFLCGFRSECVWTGEAISFLTNAKIGWGSSGTLSSALSDNNVNTASHKDYFFAYRLINQMKKHFRNIEREYDRVFTIVLNNGKKIRVGMLLEYEPTADAVRSFWEQFGPVDVIWNINPNGNPTKLALEAGHQLGCGVLKWVELKHLITR